MAKFHHECFDDPWVIERSRAMNAEIAASPEQGDFMIWSWPIFEKHRAAAEKDDPEKAKALGPGLDDGLRRAAFINPPTLSRWGWLGSVYEPYPDELFSRRSALWQRQNAESWKTYAILNGRERWAALCPMYDRHREEERQLLDQWYAEHPEQKRPEVWGE